MPFVRSLGDEVVDIHEIIDAEETQRIIWAAAEAELAALAHEHDLIAQLKVQRCVRDHDDGLALFGRKPPQRVHEIPFRSGIKTGGRLVQEEQAGVSQQLDRDARPLALSAAELLYH